MTKILFRFFVLCILITIGVALLAFYLDKRISAKENYAYMNTITQGKFSSLDDYLKNYSPEQWQAILGKMQPKNASKITVIPIKLLSLDKHKMDQLMQNKIVTIFDGSNTFYPAIVLKKTADPRYAYQEFLNFSLAQRAHQYFGWPPLLIARQLKLLPEEKWPQALKKLSAEYGFDIQVIESTSLKQNQWMVSLPKNAEQIIEHITVPLWGNKFLQFGPIHYIFIGVYAKYFIFTSILIVMEAIIFILALLFLRTLSNLKKLASDYSKGHFESPVKISSNSALFPLFNDLQAMGAKIKSLIAAHKELTHAVSHELRTPLTRLRFSLELSQQSLDLNDVKHRLSSMEEDVLELEQLISEMLSYAKFDQSKLNLEIDSIELSELIFSAISQVQKLECPVKIVTKIPNEMRHIRVNVDKKYFIRSLLNLLQNAARFARSTIEVSLEEYNQNSWQLSIDDDGPGIAMEDRLRVFEPFVQLTHAHKRSAGFGLGLAIVKKILDQHHCTIQIVDSKLGGTRFILIGKLAD